MDEKENLGTSLRENEDTDSMMDVLASEAPPAPDLRSLKESEAPAILISQEKESLKARELALKGIDDFLISGGVRLILFLPIIVVVLFGLAQSYRGSDPGWWTGSISGLFFDLRLSTAIYALSLAIMVADLVLLFILHYLLWITQRIFQLETDEITNAGMTFRSVHGYTEMWAVINGVSRQLNLTTTLMVLATIFLGLALNFPSGTSGVPVLIALSTGTLLSGHSVYMVSNRPRINTVKPWGLLDAFSPPIHPALLNKPFSDVIRAHVDPLLSVRVSKYVSSFSEDLRSGGLLSDFQEYLLQLLHMFRSGLIDEEEFHFALESAIDPKTIDQIINHPDLGEETLDRLLMHARQRCAPFFRLHDRLRMHLENPSPGVWFDVDMENLTLGHANLFAFVLNQTDESQDLILRVQTPDFRPNECVYRLHADPQGDGSSLREKPLFELLTGAMLSSRIVWQSLIPSSMGETTVTVRLEDSSGNLISGKVLTAQVKSDLFTRLRMTTGALFMLGAALAVFSPLVPFLASLLGL
ncbi:MAG: hypothetical protein CMA54_04500 [Euryarchaeota archaeon]|nr:hypothetical protein [Euryarchaeota archaeon]